MVVENCCFDPVQDICPVSQTGFIDLKSAFVNNAIPSVIDGSEDDYNGIADPASILGRPRDVFEAMDMQAKINSFTPPQSNESE